MKSAKNQLKILLVEDEPIARMVNSGFLKELGYEPDEAITGNQAVKMAKNNYDLIFMDIGLPDINGMEAADKIRKNNLIKKRPCIIGLTGFKHEEIYEKCLSVGMDDVLNKPITPDKLAFLISKFCR